MTWQFLAEIKNLQLEAMRLILRGESRFVSSHFPGQPVKMSANSNRKGRREYQIRPLDPAHGRKRGYD